MLGCHARRRPFAAGLDEERRQRRLLQCRVLHHGDRRRRGLQRRGLVLGMGLLVAVVGEGEPHAIAVDTIEAPDALAHHRVEGRLARQRVQRRVVVAGDESELFEMEAIAFEVDLQVVGPDVDVAMQLEAVGHPHAVVGEDAAAAGHAPAGVHRAADAVVRHIVIAGNRAADHVGARDPGHVDVVAGRWGLGEHAQGRVEPGFAGIQQPVAIGVADVPLRAQHGHRAVVVAQRVGRRVIGDRDAAQRARAQVLHLESEGRDRALHEIDRAVGVVRVLQRRGLIRVDGVDRLDDADARRGGARAAEVVRQIVVAVALPGLVHHRHGGGVALLARKRRTGRAEHAGRGEEPDLIGLNQAISRAVAADVDRCGAAIAWRSPSVIPDGLA